MATVLPDQIVEAVQELKEIRATAAQLKKRETNLRDQILMALDGNDRGLTGSGAQVVHVETQHRRTVNSAKLQAMYPDAYDDCTSETTVTVLKTD